MTLPDWLAMGGFVTGGIGLVVSVITYLFTRKTKALDLRLELRKAASDVRAAVASLPPLMDRVANWMERSAAASGNFGSGATEKFRARVQHHREQTAALAAKLPPTEEAYEGHSHAELQSALVSIHELKREANVLVALYEKDLDSLVSDLEARRNEATVRAQR